MDTNISLVTLHLLLTSQTRCLEPACSYRYSTFYIASGGIVVGFAYLRVWKGWTFSSMMPVTKEALKQGLSTIRSGLHRSKTDKRSSGGIHNKQQYYAVVLLCVTFLVSLSALS